MFISSIIVLLINFIVYGYSSFLCAWEPSGLDCVRLFYLLHIAIGTCISIVLLNEFRIKKDSPKLFNPKISRVLYGIGIFVGLFPILYFLFYFNR